MILFRVALTGCLLLLGVHGLLAAELPKGWTTDWNEATRRAEEEEKPIFVVFSATWCAPCQAMVKGIYPQEKVHATLQDWVPIYIDVDKHQDIAEKYHVASLPTMVYLNPDQSEINRTVGAISTIGKMVELLNTRGGAKYEGGSRSPLVARKLQILTTQIEASPQDTDLRRQRVDLVLDEILDSTSLENLPLAEADLQAIARLDFVAYAEMAEETQLYSMLEYMHLQPQLADYVFQRFTRQFPNGSRNAQLHAYLARSTMQAANYEPSARYMKAYLQRYPKGGYVDEFNLLLPQIEDFLKLTDGVSFD